MAAGDFSIAKVSRPRITGVLPRERIFRLLDAAGDCPLIWISGPAGAGKTTLISSWLDSRKRPSLWYQADEGDADIATFFYYLGIAGKKAAPRYKKPLPLLTPEYLLGIETFTRRYFEALCSRLTPPFFLVFDNYQDIPAESGLHAVLLQGLSVLPSGIGAVIISRTEPLPACNALRLKKAMFSLEADEIRFTEDETRTLIEAGAHTRLRNELVSELHRRTHGWAAGLVLYSETLKYREHEVLQPGRAVPEELFDYFAGEVLEKADDQTRQFLLRTSFLPSMTASMAERLSGIHAAGRTLSELVRKNYFVSRSRDVDPVYQYHPLFREFLLSRAEDRFPLDTLSSLRMDAAVLLEKTGLVEDAVDLFQKAENWTDAARLICNQAPVFLGQGRFRTVAEWIEHLPGELVEHSAHLLYWRGMSLVSLNAVAARGNLERAFDLFKRQSDVSGMLFCIPAVIDTYVFEWNDFNGLGKWIAESEDLMRSSPVFPTPESEARVAVAMVTALLYHRPDHPRFGAWLERLHSLMNEISDPNLCMQAAIQIAVCYSWFGQLAELATATERLRHAPSGITPFYRIAAVMPQAIYLWQSHALFEECMQIIAKGRELADSTGVHVLDHFIREQGVYSALITGDIKTAEKLLLPAEQYVQDRRIVFRSHYAYMTAWIAWLKGDFVAAHVRIQEAVSLVQQGGAPFPTALCLLAMAQVHVSRREYAETESRLRQARPIVRGMKSKILDFMDRIIEAQVGLGGEKEAQANRTGKGGTKQAGSLRASLERAMSIGREQGYKGFPWWHSGVMARLCVEALELGIETEYVRELVRSRNLVPEVPPIHLESWPWPLKIFALGRFAFSVNDRPVRFTGKVQKKPLDLLKAVIALGGRDVSEHQLSDVLWPEAAGDAAHSAFSTTLQRLRQILGREDALVLKDGKLSLDQRLCWTDVWAFEQTLGRVDAAVKGGRADQALRLTEQALALYGKGFLPGDAEQPWTIALRERLMSRFIRAVSWLGGRYEHADRWEEAVKTYQQGIEKDNLAEEFYQRLMTCYTRLDRRAEALAVYDRCRKVLAAVLGVEPSRRTQELAEALRPAVRKAGPPRKRSARE